MDGANPRHPLPNERGDMRKKGRKILVPLTFHSLNAGGSSAWFRPHKNSPLSKLGAVAYEHIREALFAPSPFARLRQNVLGVKIAADLVPHFDSSWRPLQARRLWRNAR